MADRRYARAEAFLIAFSRLKDLREPPAFASWLGSIAIRIARSRLRRHSLLRRFGLADAAPLDTERLVSADASPETTAELRALYALLDALPIDARIALVLRRVEGRTVAEVASCMGVSESTAKRHIAAGEVLLASRLARGRRG